MNHKIVFTLAMMFCSIMLHAKSPIKALIVTGQNNAHNWAASHLILQKHLNESGLFVADIAVSPRKGEDMSGFQPDFSAYQVVVLDYDGDSWSNATNAAFLDYVRKGGGVVVYHAADNPFPEWKEYNEIIGLGGWGGRNERHGPYVYFKDGKEVRDLSPGRGGSHGRQHVFKITVRDRKHPITKGLPATWTHAMDELYDRLRGPALNMTVLATAFSDRQTGGTDRDEPVLMTIKWGKGRIFHTVLGHVGGNELTHPSVESASFIVTFLRGAEWAATGKVKQKVPADFPKN
jgi:type 1 glutamine amidotransferase